MAPKIPPNPKRKRIESSEAEGYSPFLKGADLPERWKMYHNLPLVPEKYFYIKDIVESSDLGKIQLSDALELWKKKQLVHYGKPNHKFYPSLTKLFYSSMKFNPETNNIEVQIGNEGFSFSEEDVVGMFQHTSKFLRAASNFHPPTEPENYPTLSVMSEDLFMLPATNKRHHLKHHTHILLHRLIQSNIIPSLGSKDVLKKEIVTLMYGILHKIVIPAHVIFHQLRLMCNNKPLSLPYPSLITALLVKKGYKIPDNTCEGIECSMFKAGDWSRGFNNAYQKRFEAFQAIGKCKTKGLILDGEPVQSKVVPESSSTPIANPSIQLTHSQDPSSSTSGSVNDVVLEAINELKGMIISNNKEVRSRLEILEGKFGVFDSRFDALDRSVQQALAEIRVYCGEGQDNDIPIEDDDEFTNLFTDGEEEEHEDTPTQKGALKNTPIEMGALETASDSTKN